MPNYPEARAGWEGEGAGGTLLLCCGFSHKGCPAFCSGGWMPTQAWKQPRVTWGKTKDPWLETVWLIRAGPNLYRMGSVSPLSPAGTKAQSSHAGTCWPGTGFAQNAAPADNAPLQRGHAVQLHPPNEARNGFPVTADGLSHVPACSAPGEGQVRPRKCSWQSRFDALCIYTSMAECLAAADGCSGVARGDSQWSALVDATAISDLTILHTTKIQMHEQAYLLEKFFTSKAFKLWTCSGMDCI